MDRTRIHYREREDRPEPEYKYVTGWPFLTIGYGSEKDYFVENLSLLVQSGMGITAALESINKGVKNKRLKKVLNEMVSMVNSGFPLWRAFSRTRFLPERIISLVKAGEESGKLPEHLNLVTIQQHKEKVFTSRLRSALLYPGIVIVLAIVVALGSAWVTLPKLTDILSESEAELPFFTQVIVWFGDLVERWGSVLIPGIFVFLLLLMYFGFSYSKTKFIGEWVLLRIPGVDKLVQGVELSRFGFIFGALLSAGLPLGSSLESVHDGTRFSSYRKFYKYLKEGVEAGETFSKLFDEYSGSERFIPIPMQQLLSASEVSGKLPETLMKIGQIFEDKTEVMSRDLATVLEPLVLIFVGLVVGAIVLGIVSPIYQLAGGL